MISDTFQESFVFAISCVEDTKELSEGLLQDNKCFLTRRQGFRVWGLGLTVSFRISKVLRQQATPSWVAASCCTMVKARSSLFG